MRFQKRPRWRVHSVRCGLPIGQGALALEPDLEKGWAIEHRGDMCFGRKYRVGSIFELVFIELTMTFLNMCIENKHLNTCISFQTQCYLAKPFTFSAASTSVNRVARPQAGQTLWLVLSRDYEQLPLPCGHMWGRRIVTSLRRWQGNSQRSISIFALIFEIFCF